MAPTILHVSGVVGSPLVDKTGERLGGVEDVIVRLDGNFPPVTGLMASIGGRELYVPVEMVAGMREGNVQLSGNTLNLKRFERREGEVLLKQDLLGRKMIHVEAAVLVRAHEIELAYFDGWWRVVGIDPSPRAWLKRFFQRGAHTHDKRPIIEWTELEPFVSHVPGSRLRLPSRKLAKLHAAQIADLVEAASHEEGEEIIQAVGQDRELEADVYEELDEHHQLEFIRERPDDQVAQVLSRMAADDAADLVVELEQERRARVLALLPPEHQRQIRELLGYNPSTAGGMMSLDFLSLPEDMRAADALEKVRESESPSQALTTVYATGPRGELTGAIPVVALLRADGDEALSELGDREPVHVHADGDMTEVARVMTDYNLTMLPVLDDKEQPIGVVTVDDVLERTLPAGWRRRFGLVGER